MRRKNEIRDLTEKTRGDDSAYVSDLPGCVATAVPLAEIKRPMLEGIELHMGGMREDGISIPEPMTEVDYAEAA